MTKSQSKNQTKPIYNLKNSKFFPRHQNLLLPTYYFEYNVCFISKGYIDFFLSFLEKKGRNRGRRIPHICDGLVINARSEAHDHDKLPSRKLLYLNEVISLLLPYRASTNEWCVRKGEARSADAHCVILQGLHYGEGCRW